MAKISDMSYSSLRDLLISHDITIDQLIDTRDKFQSSFNDTESMSNAELRDMLYILLDVYSCDTEGRVILTDHQYDILMNEWIERGNERIIYPDDYISESSWPMIKHEDPGTVGSLNKVYEEDDLVSWLTRIPKREFYPEMRSYHNDFIIAPKFDGISGSIKVVDGKIEYAATRKDGSYGQNITAVVKKMSNASSFITSFERQYCRLYSEDSAKFRNGFYKVEFVMTTDEFGDMKNETDKTYANRRSAVSGIINTPSNIMYGEYITIIPLLYRDFKDSERVFYAPPYSSRIIVAKKYSSVLDEVEESMIKYRMPQFPIRVDGVVIYEVNSDRLDSNDYMSCGIAYKANTAESPTTIRYLYMSIGRLGKATPMAKIEPTDVNETTVEDVSLGSYQKYLSRHLHEGELVTVFSAGDVIPQLKPMNPPEYKKGSPLLELPLICPHCNHDLEKVGKEYACVNDECPRIASGKIVNFISKIGAKNISDATIYELYELGFVCSIEELFTQAVDLLVEKNIKGWNDVSIQNLDTELKRLQSIPIEISKFIGAMGIKGIAKKKSRAVFRELDLKFFLKADKEKMKYYLLGIEGFAGISAEIFASWMENNRKELKSLMELFNIVPDKPYKGTIVFTGFRDDDLADIFDNLGYEIVDNVTAKTIAVVTSSMNNDSTKLRYAISKGIDIVSRDNVEELILALKRKDLLSS